MVDVRLLALRGGQVGLDLVVLAELGLDIVVDARDFLAPSVLNKIYLDTVDNAATHLLQQVNQFRNRPAVAVLDLVPLEVPQVLVYRLVVDGLLLLDLVLLALEDILQAVPNLIHHGLTGGSELGQVIRLLHEGVECADLEGGNRERDRGAYIAGDGCLQGGEGFVGVVGRRYRGGQRDEEELCAFGHVRDAQRAA
jgi:hypothetical protein